MILLPLQDVIRAIPITQGNASGLLLLPLRGLGVRLNIITKNLVFCINFITFAPSEQRLRQLL
jgi:hypothetical protein